KTPGMILMRGNARIAGRGDDAKVDFYLPQSLEFGAAYRLTERLTVVVLGKWTEFSVIEDTNLEFERHRALNGAAVNAARDGFRFGGGIQYLLLRGVTLSTGVSWEPWAVKASSLMPTLPDLTEYTLFPVGVTIDRSSWRVSLTAGWGYIVRRRVTAERNPRFPGTYALDQAFFGLQITRYLGEGKNRGFKSCRKRGETTCTE
ncbi:MAG: outer membrane protein transport protein, partial [Candidatus Binatia bacterium]